MDFLLNDALPKIKNIQDVDCLYVVNEHLKYVSMRNNNKLALYQVDSDGLTDLVESVIVGETLDSTVISSICNVCSVSSKFETVSSQKKRVVSIKTSSGDFQVRKKASPKDQEVVSRYFGCSSGTLF